jgi:cobalamin biosynthesis Co2+ chelatase CbiK
MKIEIYEEDILNLKNAINRLIKTKTPDYEPIEIFTITEIINQFRAGNKQINATSKAKQKGEWEGFRRSLGDALQGKPVDNKFLRKV